MKQLSNTEKEQRLLRQLKKYEHKQPGEKYDGFEVSKTRYNLQEKIQFIQRNRHELNLTDDDISQVIYILRSVQDLRILYRKIHWETIVLAICVAVKEKNSKKIISFRDYNIIKRYKLTLKIYSTVTRRLWQMELQNKPLYENDYPKSRCNPTMIT